MFVDTHAHLDFPDYDGDREEVIRRAREAGIFHIIDVGIDAPSSRKALELASLFPEVTATVAVHPHEADGLNEKTKREIEALARSKEVVAIGETGLDFYRLYSTVENQEAAFRWQIELALALNRPLIIHNRNAFRDCMRILKEYGPGLRGVAHCFSGGPEEARAFVDLGFSIGFAGPLTYRKSENLRAALRSLPLDRILLETDCPFLVPQPKRGRIKRNEPAFLAHTARTMADIRSLSIPELGRITSGNAARLFGLGLDPSAREAGRPEAVIAYTIGRRLYLNLTNRCTNRCSFCDREGGARVAGWCLRLDRDPTRGEIYEALAACDLSRYDEVVFCGYGEPTLRIGLVKELAKYLKDRGCTVRLNTNGQADLIWDRPVARELAGLVDRVSISLNEADPGRYAEICRPDYGSRSFPAVLRFIRDAKAHIPSVTATVVRAPGVDLEGARKIAEDLGVGFRVREYNVVG
jgi:TatD DNase family protein